MATVTMDYTFNRVLPVLSIVRELAEQYDEFDDTIEKTVFVQPFTTRQVTGLHFSDNNGERCCNIVGDNKGDGFRFNIGVRGDYDAEHKFAHDQVELFMFNHDEHYALAVAVLDWIVMGVRPDRNSR